jgi:nitroreductase
MLALKKFIWKITPGWLHHTIRSAFFFTRLLPNYAYDLFRFLRLSGINKSNNYREERAARITMFYHQIEKGLSLKATRPAFGMAVLPQLLGLLDEYFRDHGAHAPGTTAMAALREYLAFNESMGVSVPAVAGPYQRLLATYPEVQAAIVQSAAGAVHVLKRDISPLQALDFPAFFGSRHSIRHFSGGNVNDDQIRRVAELARKTPSVCNRQSSRLHDFRDPTTVEKILALQAGNRGFGDQASGVVIVTSDLRAFVDPGERNQCWIDGGMYAMSILLAFHHLGLGTCCLNWSKERGTDTALRKLVPIAEHEAVIMVIAYGTLPDELNVAMSPRLPVSDILTIH